METSPSIFRWVLAATSKICTCISNPHPLGIINQVRSLKRCGKGFTPEAQGRSSLIWKSTPSTEIGRDVLRIDTNANHYMRRGRRRKHRSERGPWTASTTEMPGMFAHIWDKRCMKVLILNSDCDHIHSSALLKPTLAMHSELSLNQWQLHISLLPLTSVYSPTLPQPRQFFNRPCLLRMALSSCHLFCDLENCLDL